jgi:hypothetical protein
MTARKTHFTLWLLLGSVLIRSALAGELEQVRLLLDSGDALKAQARIETYLSKHPGDFDGRFLLARALTENGSTGRAMEIYRGLVRDFPNRPEPRNNLAALYAEEGELEKARDTLKAALRTNAAYATVQANLEAVYARIAAGAYRRALDLKGEGGNTSLALLNGNEAAPAGAGARSVSGSGEAKRKSGIAVTGEGEKEKKQPRAGVARVVEAEPEAVQKVAAQRPDSKPVLQDDSDSGALFSLVEGWRKAWAAQDVDAYLAYYSPRFRPSKGSYKDWRMQRYVRLTNRAFIEVEIDSPVISFLDKDRAHIRFRQHYRSDKFEDLSMKTLIVRRSDKQWLIVQEYSEPLPMQR